ncbi:hypothetical protein FE257_004457 [Aspergillus nanangensis]|uniref:Major facilitator superfamily (MFS) profile domain-containing protein n=1 Tax=Aspergillus nanangensis TaxID=2582783 RepID=A0AAD4GZD2_ASPNN|nr:hypothetical protein FE257_004457 [Aspergillus nanangensis]
MTVKPKAARFYQLGQVCEDDKSQGGQWISYVHPPTLALAMLIIVNIANGMSWGSMQWAVPPEITPLHLRHIGGALAPASMWLWTMVIVLMAPPAIANVGWKIFLLFDIGMVVGIVLASLTTGFFLSS